jgi:hypothetical protein
MIRWNFTLATAPTCSFKRQPFPENTPLVDEAAPTGLVNGVGKARKYVGRISGTADGAVLL